MVSPPWEALWLEAPDNLSQVRKIALYSSETRGVGAFFRSPWLLISRSASENLSCTPLPALPTAAGELAQWWEPHQESAFGAFDVIPRLTIVHGLAEA